VRRGGRKRKAQRSASGGRSAHAALHAATVPDNAAARRRLDRARRAPSSALRGQRRSSSRQRGGGSSLALTPASAQLKQHQEATQKRTSAPAARQMRCLALRATLLSSCGAAAAGRGAKHRASLRRARPTAAHRRPARDARPAPGCGAHGREPGGEPQQHSARQHSGSTKAQMQSALRHKGRDADAKQRASRRVREPGSGAAERHGGARDSLAVARQVQLGRSLGSPPRCVAPDRHTHHSQVCPRRVRCERQVCPECPRG